MLNTYIAKALEQQATYNGLTNKTATKLLSQFGSNSLPTKKEKTLLQRALKIFGEPMILLLLASGTVYFFLGDKVETTILFLSVIPVVLMEYFQEAKTDEAIKALDKLIVQFSAVYRDGKVVKLDSRELVPGDLVYLTAGDRIPADGILVHSAGLMVDESILTGESVTVIKSEFAQGKVQNKENSLFQGTAVTQGAGKFLVMATGSQTEYGKLGNLLQNISEQQTPLQKKMHRLVRVLAVLAITVAFLVGMLIALRQGFVVGLLGGLTITMSLIPEEFPIVFSVFLIMGVWRMTKQKALVREMAMVEVLGSTTVICTDKTGTLTEGKMALRQLYYHGELREILKEKNHDQEFSELLAPALLALERVATDPIETEVQAYATELGIDVEKFYNSRVLVLESSFNSESKVVSHLWQENDVDFVQYTAGAPESILTFCNSGEPEKKKILATLNKMSGDGYRVIGVARKNQGQEKKIELGDLEFVGLLGLSDPPRAGVKEAVGLCQKAGVRVVMITGDNKMTAHSIAELVGLNHNENILSGDDIAKISSSELAEIIKKHNIFARVLPEQKYLIVDALQKSGEVVAMTGDGVNDAPALKKADIGIAMGLRGTEVARGAAGIVLLDDNFATIVRAIKEGRTIYDNLRQAFVFLFSFHIPIVGMAILPLLFGHPLFFYPIHIIFLELFCDPIAVLGFDREKARHGLMNEAPRSPSEPLISHSLLWRVIIQGFLITAGTFGLYYYYGILGKDPVVGRTMAFTTLVLSQIFLVMISREWQQVKSNKFLLVVSVVTVIFVFTVVYLPSLQNIFHLTSLSNINLLIFISVSALIALFSRLLLSVRQLLFKV